MSVFNLPRHFQWKLDASSALSPEQRWRGHEKTGNCILKFLEYICAGKNRLAGWCSCCSVTSRSTLQENRLNGLRRFVGFLFRLRLRGFIASLLELFGIFQIKYLSLRMFASDPASLRCLWMLLRKPEKMSGSYCSPLTLRTSIKNLHRTWSKSAGKGCRVCLQPQELQTKSPAQAK